MTTEIIVAGQVNQGELPELFAPDKRTHRKGGRIFYGHIRNPNTRRAYVKAAGNFAAWCQNEGITTLAAVRMLYDWLVVGQIVPSNPASSVRGAEINTPSRRVKHQ